MTGLSSSLSFPPVREDFPSGELAVTDDVCTSQSNPMPIAFALGIWGQAPLFLYHLALQIPLSAFSFLMSFS